VNIYGKPAPIFKTEQRKLMALLNLVLFFAPIFLRAAVVLEGPLFAPTIETAKTPRAEDCFRGFLFYGIKSRGAIQNFKK